VTPGELRKLPLGTEVKWDDGTVGRVLSAKGKPTMIEWPGGELTDASDDWALEHVSLKVDP
jgi:hypothetical protein